MGKAKRKTCFICEQQIGEGCGGIYCTKCRRTLIGVCSICFATSSITFEELVGGLGKDLIKRLVIDSNKAVEKKEERKENNEHNRLSGKRLGWTT